MNFKRLCALLLLVSSTFSSQAAITFVDSDIDSGYDSDATLTIPSGTRAGDLLLVHLAYRNRSGTDDNTAPAGWTSIGGLQNESELFQQLYYKIAVAGDAGSNTNWDFDGGGNRRFVATLSRYRGVDFSDPIDTSSAWAARMPFDSAIAPSVTTTDDNAMLVAFYSVEAGNDSFIQSAGLTEAYDRETGNAGNGVTASSSYVIQASAGVSGDKNARLSNAVADDAIGQLVALNEGPVLFPAVQSAGGACGTDNLVVVQFDSFIDDLALDPALYSLNGATVDSVSRQSDDTLVLSVSGFVGGQSYQLSFNGNDTTVSFQGVLGRYFDQRSGGGGSKVSWNNGGLFTGNEFYRLDNQINFNWNRATPTVFPSLSGNDERFSIRWTGYLAPTVSGNYEFRLYSDDGVRFDLDSTEIINDWNLHGPRYSAVSAAQSLNANDLYQIQMEHFEHTGQAVARLEWRRDGGSWEPVPNANLNTCPSITPPITPILEMRMDEVVWNGTVGEVIDSSGNGYHGTAENGAINDNVTPAIAGNPGTCRYGEFDDAGASNGDYISIPNFPDLAADFTIAAWIRTHDRTEAGQRIFADDRSNSRGYALSVGDPGAGRLRFYSRGVSPVSMDSSAVIQNDTWYFVAGVADIANRQRTIYIFAADGTLLDLTQQNYTGTWGVDTGPATVGGEPVGGETNNRFDGNIDEVKVFGQTLDQSQIEGLLNDTRPCNAAPVAFYSFEQSPWNTAGTSIEDKSGNNYDGVSLGNSADNADGYVCRGADIPNNSSVAQIDAINTQQDINTLLGNQGTIMLWYRAESNWIGSGNRTLVDASTSVLNNANDKYFYLSKQNDGRLRFALEDSSDRDFNIYTGAQGVAAGDWVNIAIVWDLPNDQAQIFVNGVREANQSFNSNGVLGDLGPVYIGDNSSGYAAPGNSAFGRVDEIRFYAQPLDAAGISAAMAETHPCDATCALGSFAIAQPDYGLACPNARAEIMLTAMCSDGVTPKTDYSGTVSLTSNENSSSSFFNTASGGSAISNTVFDGSENGEKLIYLFHDNVNPAVLVTANDGSVSTTSSDSTRFGATGFIASSPGNFTCGNSTSVTLTAIGQDTSSGGSCVRLTNFSGSKDLKAWSQINIDVSESPGVADSGLPNSISINGSSIGSSQPATANTSANFVNGVGTLNIEYGDVGEVLSMNLRHDDAPYDGSVVEFSPLLASLSSFVVSPDQVDVQASDTTASLCSGSTQAALGNCSRFTAAGSDFSIDTRALCSDSSLAQSYRGTVNLTHQLIAPSAGTAGTLSVNSVAFDGTEATPGQRTTTNQQVSEVGVFTLTTSPVDYFGQNVAGAVSNNIGRFIPDHFDVSTTDGSFENACGGFTYLGQGFGYDVSALPNATITARNANNAITQNYTDVNFNKLSTSSVSRAFPLSDDSQVGADSLTLLSLVTATNSGVLSVDSPGNLFYEFNTADVYTYEKDTNSLVSPFTTALTISGSISDSDGVSANASPTWTPTGVEQRYGRWNIESSAGPSYQALPMSAGMEYLDASLNFVPNTDDSCTDFSTASTSVLSVRDTDGNTVDSSGFANIAVGSGQSSLTFNTPMVSGDASMQFSAPGDAGTLEVFSDLTDFPWLRYDWTGAGLEDPPSVTAQFGQFRGHDRIIFWRELGVDP